MFEPVAGVAALALSFVILAALVLSVALLSCFARRPPRSTLRFVFAVGIAVVLVGVGTLYTVFPSLTQESRLTRGLLLGGWILVVVVGTLLAAIADDRLQRDVRDERERLVRAERRAVLRDQLGAMFIPGLG